MRDAPYESAPAFSLKERRIHLFWAGETEMQVAGFGVFPESPILKNIFSMHFWQIVVESAAEAAAPEGYHTIALWELLLKGGWVMIPLAALLIAAIYIFFERYFVLRKARKFPPNFMDEIRRLVLEGNITGAMDLCRKYDNPAARMIEKGLSRIGRSMQDITAAIENVANLEVYKLERNLSILATIAGAAPMLGFLGTVTGMIRAFYQLATAGNNIDPSMLAGGIYEAMITTATGLLIGIIAYVGYNYLSARIDRIIFKMEAVVLEFLDMLHQPAD